ncbi:GLPGLI family protein [Hymenobacter sp. ISL-91]|uniref:GLPGLI family protein n=1 Tax=Hymenobacter sp. ISL-91 TaxID=2819151 RepID=UPI001BEA0892|nr:GLPGLI family protein [Hymenobacter sp. ISL-91]MBT2558579.1 GLPGLI family protein [Hymenobacter sp. ISL-91]
MKKILVPFLFFHYYSAFSQDNLPLLESPTIIAVYNVTYQQDSTNIGKKSELMTLTITPNYSLFESNYSHLADSVIKSPSFNQSSVNLLGTYLRSAFTQKIYKIYTGSRIEYYDKIGQKVFHIKQDNKSIKWNILNEKKEISGFSCQKAATTYAGRNWEAWFTKDIPISDGPYKFSGLPGLIIELKDSRNSYAFELIKLKRNTSTVKVEFPINTTQTTYKEYTRAKSDWLYNGVSQVTRKNSPNNYAKEMEEYKQKQARKNNPIELK